MSGGSLTCFATLRPETSSERWGAMVSLLTGPVQLAPGSTAMLMAGAP